MRLGSEMPQKFHGKAGAQAVVPQARPEAASMLHMCVCVCETCFASGCNTGSKHKIFLSGIDALGNVGKIWRPERGLRMVSGFESWEKGLFSKVASNSVLTTLWV